MDTADARTPNNLALTDPVAGCPSLVGLVSVYFEKLDTWLVEDDEQIGHPRDPFHRVDTRRSSRHVVVRVGGEVVADTRRPVAVVETGLPVRWYVPEADVRDGVLEPSDSTSVCPYKGVANYEHVTAGGRRYEDAAWCYQEPLLEALPAAGATGPSLGRTSRCRSAPEVTSGGRRGRSARWRAAAVAEPDSPS